MKFAWRIAALAVGSALVAGCAATRPAASSPDCTLVAASARGSKDGASHRKARSSYLQACPAEIRVEAVRAYRDAFAAARPKRAKAVPVAEVEIEEEEAETPVSPEAPAALELPGGRGPSNLSWVCEIEADTRVFTGVGITRDEALGSARSTCGSHFQASYCTKADCKQSL